VVFLAMGLCGCTSVQTDPLSKLLTGTGSKFSTPTGLYIAGDWTLRGNGAFPAEDLVLERATTLRILDSDLRLHTLGFASRESGTNALILRNSTLHVVQYEGGCGQPLDIRDSRIFGGHACEIIGPSPGAVRGSNAVLLGGDDWNIGEELVNVTFNGGDFALYHYPPIGGIHLDMDVPVNGQLRPDGPEFMEFFVSPAPQQDDSAPRLYASTLPTYHGGTELQIYTDGQIRFVLQANPEEGAEDAKLAVDGWSEVNGVRDVSPVCGGGGCLGNGGAVLFGDMVACPPQVPDRTHMGHGHWTTFHFGVLPDDVHYRVSNQLGAGFLPYLDGTMAPSDTGNLTVPMLTSECQEGGATANVSSYNMDFEWNAMRACLNVPADVTQVDVVPTGYQPAPCVAYVPIVRT